ncbi:SepM family pheromone-processing serine protease [Acetilactobacillus jinshanensis]|uniref:PDZ domain-containing protein n=1 Tax=Acetilactobacillus jinshanensis TaxID=1720083 RepID=A0A4P6ZK48_9LACO|nr:SepM family pheromone-processing serine protease [Acetilactobacillus jinshanensis]QBP17923.1 PDZ domain-containing protein [Acetilactobacillus jinshanensis]URL60786.1 PDZ domain-containing protein [uncultured bacterium]
MKNKKLSKLSKWLLAIIGVLIFLWLLFWPMPDYIEGPGEANNLNHMVKVNHHFGRYPGKLMLTSVEIAPVHPITYVWAKLNPKYSIESEQNVTGGQNDATYNKIQKFYMTSAINDAKYVAYRNAHRFVKPNYHGIYVLGVMPTSHFHSIIHVGDVITKINGRHFNNAYGYQEYLAHLNHHSKVTVQYLHNNVEHRAISHLTHLPGSNRWGIGVILTDDDSIKTKIPVHVNSEQIGGPSGGLMLTLQMYSQIKPVNITKGRKIAGTGTIDPKGDVGEIGGIDKKIIAAKRQGATIFFAPYIKPTKKVLKYEPGHLTNYELAKRTAHKYAPNMKIVPVSNFHQALKYLIRT